MTSVYSLWNYYANVTRWEEFFSSCSSLEIGSLLAAVHINIIKVMTFCLFVDASSRKTSGTDTTDATALLEFSNLIGRMVLTHLLQQLTGFCCCCSNNLHIKQTEPREVSGMVNLPSEIMFCFIYLRLFKSLEWIAVHRAYVKMHQTEMMYLCKIRHPHNPHPKF